MRSAQRLFCFTAGQSSTDGCRFVHICLRLKRKFYFIIYSSITVPILPHFVHQGNAMQETNGTLDIGFQSGNETLTKSGLYNLLKSSAEHFHIGRGYQPEVGDNSRLGLLLSLKAIVQLVANPLVAIVIQKKGFALPLLVGTINLILCSLLFAFGRSYEVLSSARALQGITSACFTIAGCIII